jgi:hypothetical protein
MTEYDAVSKTEAFKSLPDSVLLEATKLRKPSDKDGSKKKDGTIFEIRNIQTDLIHRLQCSVAL